MIARLMSITITSMYFITTRMSTIPRVIFDGFYHDCLFMTPNEDLFTHGLSVDECTHSHGVRCNNVARSCGLSAQPSQGIIRESELGILPFALREEPRRRSSSVSTILITSDAVDRRSVAIASCARKSLQRTATIGCARTLCHTLATTIAAWTESCAMGRRHANRFAVPPPTAAVRAIGVCAKTPHMPMGTLLLPHCAWDWCRLKPA